MTNITLNFYGGSQQVNPSAQTATQVFIGDQFAKERLQEEVLRQLDLSPEAERFRPYINKVEDMPRYLSLLSACTNATELAQAVMTLLDNEPKITKAEVVKERFISKLLPLAPKLAQSDRGNSIDNIRARINDALSKHSKKRT